MRTSDAPDVDVCRARQRGGGRWNALRLGVRMALWVMVASSATACDGRVGAPAETATVATASPVTASPGTASIGSDPVAALSDSAFAALVARVSEDGGYFDTDNLISNEAGYLKVMGALERTGVRGGAYMGVGPDQNFSYMARIRPSLAFLVDIRRDNLLHHLLLKALMEEAPTRVEYLSALLGREAPPDPDAWRDRSLDEVVAWVDGAPSPPGLRDTLHARVARRVRGFGVSLDSAELATVRRFHQTFMDAGLELRFTSYGRPPRPYYPTYRRLVTETDLEGEQASYLAREEDYAFVRLLQQENRVIPVVGNLAGGYAFREVAAVLEEMRLELSAVYASNVEFYLWRDGTFPRWRENLAALPVAGNAVVIRSYFPNFGATHPSAVPGYFATQTVQPVAALVEGDFRSYWEVVTRSALPLR